jgi:hypothetical protein
MISHDGEHRCHYDQRGDNDAVWYELGSTQHGKRRWRRHRGPAVQGRKVRLIGTDLSTHSGLPQREPPEHGIAPALLA